MLINMVVWMKSAWGTSRLDHTFGDKLYFTHDIPEEKWIPKNWLHQKCQTCTQACKAACSEACCSQLVHTCH